MLIHYYFTHLQQISINANVLIKNAICLVLKFNSFKINGVSNEKFISANTAIDNPAIRFKYMGSFKSPKSKTRTKRVHPSLMHCIHLTCLGVSGSISSNGSSTCLEQLSPSSFLSSGL